jgi:hypothetical protein
MDGFLSSAGSDNEVQNDGIDDTSIAKIRDTVMDSYHTKKYVSRCLFKGDVNLL